MGNRTHWACRTAHALAWAVPLCVAFAVPSHAQSSLADERAAVFQRMFDDPANPALMLDYARLSARMGDFETVAATLERLIALQPENAAARLQLAQAYSAIGADPLAQYHLSILSSAGDLPPAAASRAAAVDAAAETRASGSSVTGRVTLGVSRQVSAATDDLTGSVILDWRQDMGGAHDQDWRTQFAASVSAPGDGGAGERQSLRLRTGPELRISQSTQGPLLQPYLQIEATRDSAGSDLNTYGFGVAYHHDLQGAWSVFSDVAVSWADNLSTGEDVQIGALTMGASYAFSPGTSARLSVNGQRENGTTEDRTIQGAGLAIGHSFDAPVGFDGRAWSLVGTATAQRTVVTGGTTPRTDRDYSFGVNLRGYMTDDLFWTVGLSRSTRLSDAAGFDSAETTASMRLGWEF